MKFKPFSRKQLKVLSWWKVDGIKDKYDAVIADGSVFAVFGAVFDGK